MVFHADTRAVILLQSVSVENAAGMAIACAVFLLVGVLHEGLRCLRTHLSVNNSERTRGISMCSKAHFIQTLLYMVEFVFSYAIMLTVMTYNVYLFIIIVCGSLIGMQICKLTQGEHHWDRLFVGGLSRSPTEPCVSRADSQEPEVTCDDNDRQPLRESSPRQLSVPSRLEQYPRTTPEYVERTSVI